ncbi:MAG: tetratricopeptide repeat protein, partial [Bacteroidales bacterium]|nr:tetratricopeptide repeat protein [Bacteroidales bacterium]
MKQKIIGKLPRTSICHLLISFILIIPMVIGIGSNCFAQKFISLKTYDVDSLLLILPGQYNEERINTLNNLSLSLFFDDIELGKQYADTAMYLAKELKFEEGMAAAFQNYGHIQTYQGNYPLALSNHLEALSLYEKLNNTRRVAWTYYNIGKAHFFARNYEKTIEYGYKALDEFQERAEGGTMVGMRDAMCITGGIAIAYDYLGETEKAIEIYLKNLDDGKKNIFGMTEILVYTYKIGTLYTFMGDIGNAIDCFEKILAFPDANPDIQALKYRPVTWLGRIYSRLGKIDTAKVYLEKAYNWYNKNGFLFWSMVVSNDLGKIHYENIEIDIALNYFKQSEMIFNEMLSKNSWYRYDSLKYVVNFGLEIYFPYPHIELIEMMWTNANSMYYWLYSISKELKNKDDALKYHEAYFNAVDTLNKLQRNREIIELQTKYESERKDQQIDTLSLENELKESRLVQNRYFLFGSIGLLIVILMFGYILFRQNKLKTDQKMMGLQQKLFRSQMNPHFIFNSLASIQNFMVKQNSKKASIYLSKFSELVRSILDNSTQEYIPF